MNLLKIDSEDPLQDNELINNTSTSHWDRLKQTMTT